MQAGVGKASFTEEALTGEHPRASTDAVSKAKPSGAKGTYLKRIARGLDAGAGRARRSGIAFGELRSTEFRPGFWPGQQSFARAAQAARAKTGRQARLSGPVLSETAGELRLLSP